MYRCWALVAVVVLSPAACSRGASSGPSTRADSDGGSLTIGTPEEGTFAPGLRSDDLGKAYIDYTLRIQEPGRYRIELVSKNTGVYDPYLRLLQGGREVAHDDDGGEEPLQALIAERLEGGTYTVRVTKFGSQPVAEPVGFTLTVTRDQSPEPEPPGAPVALAIGTPLAGSFENHLPVDGEGRPYVDHGLVVELAGTYRIDLQSADIRTYDPLVRLLRDGREVAYDDDGGDSALQSRLERELTPGSYVVRVSRFNEGQIRAPVEFTLAVARVGGAEPASRDGGAGSGDASPNR